jgi:hypothetical protein
MYIANLQRNIILDGIILVFKYNLTTISSKYMVLHHIYKELNLLLYLFINLRDFWFVILIQFLWNCICEKWKLICDSWTVVLNPQPSGWIRLSSLSCFILRLNQFWLGECNMYPPPPCKKTPQFGSIFLEGMVFVTIGGRGVTPACYTILLYWSTFLMIGHLFKGEYNYKRGQLSYSVILFILEFGFPVALKQGSN